VDGDAAAFGEAANTVQPVELDVAVGGHGGRFIGVWFGVCDDDGS
jgi:hypothetical protein